MINVTQPFLPPLNEYIDAITEVWERNWITNNGPNVNTLEAALKNYLGVNNLLYLSNGTIAIQLAIKALDIKGEVITTPFSYVATTSSIVWENCIPVFADIDANSWNINPDLIEEKITPRTEAILATHVFGNPCDVIKIAAIAKKHNLKVIYDAAHCFGTKWNNSSILNYGDVSTISFHATKLFHTVEGGAVITTNSLLNKRLSLMRNFGHEGPEEIVEVGINGKNSEVHAAMGLCNLNHIDAILSKRKNDHALYDGWLSKLGLQKPLISEAADYNYSYYPVVFDSLEQCIEVFTTLKAHDVFARRYFNPVLSNLNYVIKSSNPVSESVSSRILCLPLYFALKEAEIALVCKIILKTLNNK